ncbi:MAG: hypothetical protein K2Q01_08875, partial [Rickettsiales bacterium]|nr:hypothetical protein [Rickettsiales bacterium]
GLGGKPITAAEQAQIIAELEKLNAAGVHHRDLGSNTGFARGKDGKLTLGVWDFDDDAENTRSDIENLRTFFADMQKAGTAQATEQSKWAKPGLKEPDAVQSREDRKKRTWESPD